MLSRTADHLFWMSRYTERAENTARMLDVNYQTSLLPQSDAVAQMGWQGLLSISELTGAYTKQYGDVKARDVIDFMVKDESNPSSIVSCLGAARENARAVRGALTTEVWETQNQTWLEVKRMIKSSEFDADPSQFFEWVKFRSHLSRGVTVGTMLMDEALHFMRLGTFLERADNTARLVDVKFHAVQSDFYGAADARDQEYDFYHWSAILRSVSAFEVYRKVYRDVIRPERVAELLILKSDMPRSLHASLNEVVNNLALVSSDPESETLRRAGKLRADLKYGRIDEILATGLHAYLTQFLDRVNDLGATSAASIWSQALEGGTNPAIMRAEGVCMKVADIDRELDHARNQGPVRDIAIPPCPELLVALRKEVDKADPDPSEIARIASSDVAMAASLLRTVNSPLYARARAADTVAQAVSMLGVGPTVGILTSFLTRNAIRSNAPLLEHFWETSTRRALAMGFIARQLYGVDADVAHTCGLFCHVGIPIMMQGVKGYAGTLAEALARQDRSFTETENAAHKTDHAVVGAIVAKTWCLPPTIVVAVRLHHDFTALTDTRFPEDARTLVAMGLVAESLVARHEGVAVQREWEKHGEACLAHIRVSAGEVDAWVDALHPVFESVAVT